MKWKGARRHVHFVGVRSGPALCCVLPGRVSPKSLRLSTCSTAPPSSAQLLQDLFLGSLLLLEHFTTLLGILEGLLDVLLPLLKVLFLL